MRNPVITLANNTHRDKVVVSLSFEKDFAIINKVKSIKGASWSQSRKFWYIPKDDFQLSEVFEKLSSVAFLDCSAIEKENTDTQKDKIGNSKDGSSTSAIKKNEPQTVDVLCNEKEKTFYLSLPFELKEHFKKLEGPWWHPKLKQWSALDNEENREQLKALLQTTGLNPEFILAGLKKQSKIKTPNLENPVMPDEKFIRHMQLENKAKSTIKQYTWYITWFLTHYRNKEITKNPGELVKRAAEKAGIKRRVTPHMFRHSFATHHMEKGTELRLIQEALGHASSKTTEIYTRVSRANIKKMPNLLDDLEI